MKVSVVQPYVPDYREPFFARVSELLRDEGIEFELLIAGARGLQAARRDAVHPGYANKVPMTTVSLRGTSIRWKHVVRRTWSSDLLVVELAAGAVESLVASLAWPGRTAVWGHGYRAIAAPNPLDSAIERWMMRRAAHVFVYTERGRAAAVSAGAASTRVTVMQNSIDVVALRERIQDLSPSAATRILGRAEATRGRCVTAAIGGLDESKRVEFLLAAADRVRQRLPDFELIVAGDGAQAQLVEEAAANRPWLSYIGRAGVDEKAAIGKIASCLLNPGRIGLIAIDSFALGLPIVTTRWPYHAPEVEYLTDGVTAVFADDSVEAFVDAVAGLLRDVERRERMAVACRGEARHYGIDEPASRFVEGVTASLSADRGRNAPPLRMPSRRVRIAESVSAALRRVVSRSRRSFFGCMIGVAPHRRRGLARLGSSYGGWWVPAAKVGPGVVAYCVGAGEDVSFDLELLARGCAVRTIDPTPRAIDHIRSLEIRDDRFAFAPVGLWDRAGRRPMYVPRDHAHVSHSLVNLQQTTEYVEVDVTTLDDLMRSFGDERVDLLKLDIEGAEYEVLDSLVRGVVRPCVLCVEFDQPQPIRRSRHTIRALRGAGYRLVHVEGFNCLLVRDRC